MEGEEYQPDDFGGAADVVAGMYRGQQQPAAQPDMVDISRALGYGSFGGIAKHSKSEIFAKQAMQYQQSMAQQQAATVKAQAALNPDAQFYALVGDLSGAVQLQKSRGPSLFTFGEEFEFGKNEKYAVAPAGEMTAKGMDGKLKRIKVADLAAKSGVKTVAFRGGDQKAMDFREMLNKTNSLMTALDDLKELYGKPSLYVGKLNPSEESTKMQTLETRILTTAMNVLLGARGVGGNTSERDIELLQTMAPKAASTYAGNLKGNEMLRLEEMRNYVRLHVKGAANANGIELEPISTQIAGKKGKPNFIVNPE